MTSVGNVPDDASELRQQVAPVVVAIDDDTSFLLATAKALASAGMVCHTATTGEAGLRLIREYAPDLVLLDIILVGEDGFTICRELRRTWAPEALPVIMVTGLEDLESIKLAYESGANDFLAKPLHWKHLPFRIRHILQASHGITERKRTERMLREQEERYRAQFSLAGEGIVTHAFDGKIIEVNEAFARMHGFTPDEMAQMKVQDLDHPESSKKMAAERLGRIRAGEVLTFQVEHIHRDGHVFPLEVTASVISSGGKSASLPCL